MVLRKWQPFIYVLTDCGFNYLTKRKGPLDFTPRDRFRYSKTNRKRDTPSLPFLVLTIGKIIPGTIAVLNTLFNFVNLGI